LVVFFLSSVLITPAWAPPKEKPEKLTIGTIGYHAPASAFYVYLTAQFGIAQAGDHADFIIVTTLDVTSEAGDTIAKLFYKQGIVRLATPTAPVPGEPVPIAGPSLEWKPDKEYLKVIVRATVELQTSSGNTIGTTTKVAEVALPSCAPCPKP
jgi:hypothetical protein